MDRQGRRVDGEHPKQIWLPRNLKEQPMVFLTVRLCSLQLPIGSARTGNQMLPNS